MQDIMIVILDLVVAIAAMYYLARAHDAIVRWADRKCKESNGQ